MKSLNILVNTAVCARNFGTACKVFSSTKDPAYFFFNPDVQEKLKRLTGRDPGRIFQPKRIGEKLRSPKYEFMTKDQLQKAMKESEKRAEEKLQMPPLMSERKPITDILSEDPELQGLDTSKYVFIDISSGVPDRKRAAVVRDPDGVLRKATWEERERMLQIYFPRPGREIEPPPMFKEETVNRILEEGQYLFILDSACAQYEPDDPEYIRVTQATYNQIDRREDFDILWSTRHYGPMVLHLTMEKSVDRLLKNLIVNEKIEEVLELIQLYNFVHYGSGLKDGAENPLALLRTFLERDSLKRHILELALQSYQELIQQREQQHGSRESSS